MTTTKSTTTRVFTSSEVCRIFHQCIKDLKKLNIPISENVVYMGTNNRKKSLGLCSKRLICINGRYDNNFEITISKTLLKCDLALIKNTIYHELIHTIPNCFNHNLNFVKYMNYINSKLGCKIEVKNTNKQFKENIQYKYKITCEKCGKTFYRHKLPQFRAGLVHASDNGYLKIEQLY